MKRDASPLRARRPLKDSTDFRACDPAGSHDAQSALKSIFSGKAYYPISQGPIVKKSGAEESQRPFSDDDIAAFTPFFQPKGRAPLTDPATPPAYVIHPHMHF